MSTSTTTTTTIDDGKASKTSEKLREIASEFTGFIENKNLKELDKKMYEFIYHLNQLKDAGEWHNNFKEHISMKLVQKSVMSQVLCEGQQCAGNWQSMMLKTMSEHSTDEILRAMLSKLSNDKNTEKKNDAALLSTHAAFVVKFCSLTFITTYFWGLENLEESKFEKLFTYSFQEMLYLGWNNKHVNMCRLMLESLLRKIMGARTWTLKRNGLRLNEWRGISVILKKMEEFVFYFPPYHHGKFGVHLPGVPGSTITDPTLSDTELVKKIYTLLKKTFAVDQMFEVQMGGNDDEAKQQQTIKTQAHQELRYWDNVQKWFELVNTQDKKDYDQLVRQLIDLMQKRPLYGVEYHGVKTDYRQISFVLHGVPMDLKRRVRIPRDPGSEPQTFRDLEYRVVFGQLVAGLHVIKRIADYLQKVVDTYKKTVEDMDKVVGRDWLENERTLRDDKISEHANTCKMFHSASSSINTRLLDFARKINNDVIKELRDFHQKGEEKQKECEPNHQKCVKECKEILQKYHKVKKSREACMKDWEMVVDLNRQLEAACKEQNKQAEIREKREELVKTCYLSFSSYEHERSNYISVSSSFKKTWEMLFDGMQQLEEERLKVLKKAMEKYCEHFEAFTKPMPVLTDFKGSVDELDSTIAQDSFIEMAKGPDDPKSPTRKFSSMVRNSIVGDGNFDELDGENGDEAYGSMMKVKPPPPPLPCTSESLTSGKYKPPHDAIDVLARVMVVKSDGSRVQGIVQAPLNDGCYPISFPDSDQPDKQTMFPQECVDPNVDKKNYVCLFIGLAKHGKTETLHNLFGKDLEGKNDASRRRVEILRHPKSKSLVFLDVPGISATDQNYNERKLEQEVINAVSEVGEPDIIFVCRQFTHSQTGDYQILKRLVNSMSRKYSRAHLLLVYTRSCDAPDIDIIKRNQRIKSQVDLYRNSPYNYTPRAAKHAAFRNFRVTQANKERFHRVFFIENDDDEGGSLPDKTKCWVPLVNALAKIAPTQLDKKTFCPRAANCLKSIKVTASSKQICPACKLIGTKETDCEFCNVPTIKQNQ